MASSSEIVVARPDVTALAALAGPMVEQAQALVIVDVPSHGAALQAIQGLRGLERKITDHFEPTRKALDTAKKELLAARDSMLAPVESARQIVGQKANVYEAEQRRIAAEAQRVAQEAARKIEEERAIQEAIEAEAAGDTEQADEILAAPVEVPLVRVAPALAKVAGVGGGTRWKCRVKDPAALMACIPQHPGWWDRVVEALGPPLNVLATDQRQALNIPGCEAYEETYRSVRTA